MIRGPGIEAVLDSARVVCTPEHLHVAFARPWNVLSSAVLNGGFRRADHILNLRVPRHWTGNATPQGSLQDYCREHSWQGTCVGMMTAASMDSLRLAREPAEGIEVAALATSGLSNPRRVGDRAEYRQIGVCPREQGTINIILLCTATLCEAAATEALCIATEAKTAALYDAGVRSPVSGGMATGTGTDAIAIASAPDSAPVPYCGKHVLMGEIMGRLVYRVVADSLIHDGQ